MSFWSGLAAHQLVSLVIAFAFSSSVLSQRRPAGTTFAWLLAIFFAPYLGIPLYLSFGGRKMGRPKPAAHPLAPSRAVGTEQFALGVKSSLEEVVFLDDCVVAYEAFLREIENAKRAIRIVTFVVGDDATGRSLLDALTRRAQEGVEVHLLLDDLLRFHAPREHLARLTHAGGRIERFMPLVHVPFRGRANLRNHRKIAVFDGARAIVGGMNLADEYMGPERSETRWTDLSVLVRGEAVAALDAIFCSDWEFATKQRLARLESTTVAGPLPVRVVGSGPDVPTDPIYDAILTAVFRAERRLWIATPYFVPDEPLVRALAIAARGGVDVRIVVPARSNHALADLVAAPYLRDLVIAGVDVRMFRPGMLHAKTMLVDDSVAVVGSANFDMRSLFLDYEIALFFSGPLEVARLATWFDTAAVGIDPSLRRAGWFRSRVEEVARLLAPLM